MDKKQLSTLKQMREYLDQIDELESEIFELTERKSKESEVSKDGFKTDHAKTVWYEQFREECKIPTRTGLAVLALIAGLAVGAALIYFIGTTIFTIVVTLVLATAGFLAVKIPAIVKKKRKTKEIKDKYAPLIDEAVEKDKKEEQRYEAAVKAKKAECDRLYDPQIDQKNNEIDLIQKKYDKIKIISDKDLDEDSDIIDTFIEWMESSYADNVKECFKLKREQEAEADRRVAENLKNSPGTVIVSAAIKVSLSGWIQLKNTVIIDEKDFGPALMSGTSFTLDPGSHTIRIIVNPLYDNVYETIPISFYLEGGSTKNFKCTMPSTNNIYFKETPDHPGIDKSGNSCKLY